MGDDAPHEDGSSRIKLGICAMEKKAKSKPMNEIIDRIKSSGQFEVIIFPQKSILESPIEEWPHPIDVLISFFSEGFPLDKAEAYVALRRPHCVNDLSAQRILLDRQQVYALLKVNNVAHPNSLVINRIKNGESHDLVDLTPDQIVEGDDFISVGEKKISKPFVEKPVNAEDHNVFIYYHSSAGGGVKRLFRKVGDRSSDFDPDRRQVRRDGSYMYEPFMQTQGTDIKVYTVGPDYAHAEARKSPVIDGVVMRNENGKEIRFPVILTQKEKEMASIICQAFGQFVCGFDLLRTSEGSMVIDVNGWSFVKGMPKYYDDTAQLLSLYMLRVCGVAPIARSINCAVKRPSASSTEGKQGLGSALERARSATSGNDTEDRWANQELLAVLAVVRHADRTPKNKMKMMTKRADFLKLHQKWSAGPRKEAKLKSPKQLQELLDLTKVVLGRHPQAQTQEGSGEDGPSGGSARSKTTVGESSGSDKEDVNFIRQRTMSLDEDERDACNLICTVLEEGGNFGGIYRKVQLKPLVWNVAGDVEELLVVLKYGGILTPAGIAQAEGLGRRFRAEMYPGENGSDQYSTGLLRLHATQRHDFKVYSSDEGRVQMSAAAFARGLLALERGSLTPICAALVETDSTMLDELPRKAEKQMSRAKQALHERIHEPSSTEGSPERRFTSSDFKTVSTRDTTVSAIDAVCDIAQLITTARLKQLLERLQFLVGELNKLKDDEVIKVKCTEVIERPENVEKADGPDAEARPMLCDVSSPLLVKKRWQKLCNELWDAKKNCWNISKVPEIFDAVQFDMIHAPKLVKGIPELHAIAKELNDVIVPQEYGHDELSRLEIGALVCGPLLKKLVEDLRSGRESELAKDGQVPEQKIVFATQFLRKLGDWLPERWRTPAKATEASDDSSDAKKDEEFLGLDPELAPEFIKSPDRRVRTRLYFTSESHIQALMNVLRYCHYERRSLVDKIDSNTTKSSTNKPTAVNSNPSRDSVSRNSSANISGSDSCPEVLAPRPCIVQSEEEARMREAPVFGYLTQIVFRLYEDKSAAAGSNERYRVDVLFSPGAAGDPSQAKNHIMDVERLQPLHDPSQPITLAQLLKLLGPCVEAGASVDSPLRSRQVSLIIP